jgi:hypothetical protein
MSLVIQSILPYPDSCLGTSPHQQGWDTKMEKLSYGGIDVSKDRLDDTAGWAELVARLRPLAVSAIGLEPSGVEVRPKPRRPLHSIAPGHSA